MTIFDVIKCDESFEDRLVWKHPSEDFNTKSQLIVGAAQEAVFYLNGEGCVFKPGKYTLDTGNIPFLRKIIEFPHGGVSTFHCQVYFVNKVTVLNISWGTPSQFDCIDPVFQVPFHVGASGSMGVQIDDSLRFLAKLVGSNTNLTAVGLTGYFRDLVATRVKTYLSKVLSQVSLYSVTSYLDDISVAMHEKLREDILGYGIMLDSFFLPTIMVPETDKLVINETQNTLMRQGKLGYNWVDTQIAEIMKKYAENPGNQNNVGGMMSQMPIAYAFGQMMGQNAQPFLNSAFSNQPKAFSTTRNSTPVEEGGFNGLKMKPLKPLKPLSSAEQNNLNDNVRAGESKADKLKQMKEDLAAMKEMLDMGIINEDDYNNAKNSWLEKIK